MGRSGEGTAWPGLAVVGIGDGGGGGGRGGGGGGEGGEKGN